MAQGIRSFVEILAASGFCVLAIFGFKGNLWLVAIALVGHGIFDFARPGFIENPGVPRWWPGFCFAFDVIFGGWLVVRLLAENEFFRSEPTKSLRQKIVGMRREIGNSVRENSS